MILSSQDLGRIFPTGRFDPYNKGNMLIDIKIKFRNKITAEFKFY